jgi:hypothetical protein
MACAGALLALILAACNRVQPVDPGLVSPPPSVAEAAGSANCGVVATEANLGADHLGEGESLPPDSPQPASSGPHAPVPLPPEPSVYFEPVDEAAAVHNLEHAYVLIYHSEQLDSAVLERLATIAETEEKVIMAPYDLGRDTALAFVAWTKIQTCGPAVTAEEAEGQAAAFISRFRGSNNAPEPSAG